MKRLFKKSNNELIEKIEKDLAGEYEAIRMYEEHIASISDQRVIDVLTEIRDDEMTHVKALEKLLKTI